MTELTALAPPHAEVAAAIHARCFPQPWDRASFLSLLSMPGVFGWIARSDGDGPAGLVLCRRAGDECEVLTICVLPE
ncbi:MAG: GNAT family N-acetyltransferase, partial [Alphaproteobacteria bacterium]|nr:GNAT family N-acetyltransferase [Alphaproteobacteria bacterium]